MNKKAKVKRIVRRAKALLSEIDRKLSDPKEDKFSRTPTIQDLSSFYNNLRIAIQDYEQELGYEHIPFSSERTVSYGTKEEVRETHESYGIFQFSRKSGGRGATHLFGSHVEYHPVTISLEIRRAERSFDSDLSYERFMGNDLLIEVEMSAAQFTDSITLM